MIACPSCGGQTKALEVRSVGEGPTAYVRRRKECRSCGKRFTTSEVLLAEHASPQVMIVKTSTAKALLEDVIALFAQPGDARAAELIAKLTSGASEP